MFTPIEGDDNQQVEWYKHLGNTLLFSFHFGVEKGIEGGKRGEWGAPVFGGWEVVYGALKK